jgi:hypothetical protein
MSETILNIPEAKLLAERIRVIDSEQTKQIYLKQKMMIEQFFTHFIDDQHIDLDEKLNEDLYKQLLDKGYSVQSGRQCNGSKPESKWYVVIHIPSDYCTIESHEHPYIRTS